MRQAITIYICTSSDHPDPHKAGSCCSYLPFLDGHSVLALITVIFDFGVDRLAGLMLADSARLCQVCHARICKWLSFRGTGGSTLFLADCFTF